MRFLGRVPTSIALPKTVTNYMRTHYRENHKSKFKEMQNKRKKKSRTEFKEKRTPEQEIEYKKSESARIAKLREKKKVKAAEAKLAAEVRENLDFRRSFVCDKVWTITLTYWGRKRGWRGTGTGRLQCGSNVRVSSRDEALFNVSSVHVMRSRVFQN